MPTKCFGFNLSRIKSKSSSKIPANDSPQASNHSLSKSNATDLNKEQSYNSFNPSDIKLTIKKSHQIFEEPIQSHPFNRHSISIQSTSAKPNLEPKFFLNQSITKIRSRNKLFEDNRFLPFISSIVESHRSPLYTSLASRFRAKSLVDLNNIIHWKRASEIADHLGLSNEFVLDNDGRAPCSDVELNTSEYSDFFSTYDIGQGWIGNCFHVGAIIGLMNNKELLKIVIPPDNIFPENMDLGAYHFRLWKLGHWYDVVIDDLLPCNKLAQLVFSYNKTYLNEFWVPLFEKALAKFMGSYDELEGGIFENSALFLSGGLHDEYPIEQTLQKTLNKSQETKFNISIPDTQELLEIIKLGLLRKDMIGCILENDDIAKNFGLFIEHLYLVTDAISVDNKCFLRLHNPFNTPDEVKSSDTYMNMEKEIIGLGYKETTAGEFWIDYEEFLESFKCVKVCNLKPSELVTTESYMMNLKDKTTLLTNWHMQTFEEILPAKQRKIKYYHEDYKKYEILVNGNTKQNILFSFIQDWIKKSGTDKHLQQIELHMYAHDQDTNSWVYYKSERYESSLQWCHRVTLKPGRYLIVYECCFELINDLKYCFRVCTDAGCKNEIIKVKLFDQEPRFDPLIKEDDYNLSDD